MPEPSSRGIEVLVLKAAVDAEFQQLLLERRIAAAESIGLQLTPAEAMMLAAVPREQLEAIIARATVPHEHRRAFLGQAAAAMVAALASLSGSVASAGGFGGVRPDQPAGAGTFGIQPDRIPVDGGVRAAAPPVKAPEIEKRVMELLAEELKADKEQVTRKKSLAKDLEAKPADLDALRRKLEGEFQITLAAEPFKRLRTVGDLIDRVQQAVAARQRTERRTEKQREANKIKPGQTPSLPKEQKGSIMGGGIRADRPPVLKNPVLDAEKLRRRLPEGNQ